jgi:hypothetical protein
MCVFQVYSKFHCKCDFNLLFERISFGPVCKSMDGRKFCLVLHFVFVVSGGS